MTTTTSPDETMLFAANLAKDLSGKSVLLLEGELGAGKTCFVRGLCNGLGGDPLQVHSPTFTIVNEYDTTNYTLIHIDAYRLSGDEELCTIGWDEMCEAEDAIIAIEWPSKIKDALPNNAINILMEHVDEQTREITLR